MEVRVFTVLKENRKAKNSERWSRERCLLSVGERKRERERKKEREENSERKKEQQRIRRESCR